MSSDSTPFGECPLPISGPEEILLGHGSGGKLTARLIGLVAPPPDPSPDFPLFSPARATLDAFGGNGQN